MESETLAPSGLHPSIAWDLARRRFFTVWQSSARLDTSEGPLVTLGSAETAFPRLHAFKSGLWLGYRDGDKPQSGTGYLGRMSAIATTLISKRALGPIHGAYPCAFGNGYFAYQSNGSAAGYPVMRVNLQNEMVSEGPVRSGAPTGLALIDTALEVRTWDELRGRIPGLFDVTYAGDLCVGATDRDGQPCAVVQHSESGDELVLWPNEDSQNPVIAWDGVTTYAVVAWSSAGQGIRKATFQRNELKPRSAPATREPRLARPNVPRALAWFYDNGKYGSFKPVRTGTVLGSDMYKDGDGTIPADVYSRIWHAVDEAGSIYLSAKDRDIHEAKPYWARVHAVVIHEPDTPPAARWATTTARAIMRREALTVRPVVAVLSAAQATAEYAGVADAIALEVYFDLPAATWTAMYEQALRFISAALTALYPTPLYLVAQAYDRSDGPGPANGPWETGTGRDQLTAIAQACFDALNHERVLGLWPFAYARPGGATTYPELAKWYDAQAGVLIPPPLPAKDKPPMSDTKPVYPNPDQQINALQRISISYVNDLKRAQGIFGVPPDGLDVAIYDPTRADVRIDTKSISYWYANYNQRFVEHSLAAPGTDHHEPAIRGVEDAIRNSDEAKSHRPQ